MRYVVGCCEKILTKCWVLRPIIFSSFSQLIDSVITTDNNAQRETEMIISRLRFGEYEEYFSQGFTFLPPGDSAVKKVSAGCKC